MTRGRILFSRHVRQVVLDHVQGSDEFVNKVIAAVWDRVSPQDRSVYVKYAEMTEYREDVAGIRHDGRAGAKKIENLRR